MSDNLFKEAFGDAAELTLLLNKSKYNPGIIARLGLFSESGISSTIAAIDVADEALTLLPISIPRGGVAEVHRPRDSTLLTATALHIPTRATVMAESVQNVRALGGISLDTPEAVRSRALAGMRKNIELTLEHVRFGTIRGQIVDIDGTVMLDLFAALGLSQTTIAMDLTSSTKLLVNSTIDAERQSEYVLGGDQPSGFLALAAPDFMDALRANPSYVSDLRFAAPNELLKNFRNGITVGDTTYLEVRSTPGLPARIPAGEAYLLPLGIADFLVTRYAPADYVETVNTPGLPMYAKSQLMDFDKGFMLESQSNPINLCTRPAAVIRLLKGA